MQNQWPAGRVDSWDKRNTHEEEYYDYQQQQQFQYDNTNGVATWQQPQPKWQGSKAYSIIDPVSKEPLNDQSTAYNTGAQGNAVLQPKYGLNTPMQSNFMPKPKRKIPGARDDMGSKLGMASLPNPGMAVSSNLAAQQGTMFAEHGGGIVHPMQQQNTALPMQQNPQQNLQPNLQQQQQQGNQNPNQASAGFQIPPSVVTENGSSIQRSSAVSTASTQSGVMPRPGIKNRKISNKVLPKGLEQSSPPSPKGSAPPGVSSPKSDTINDAQKAEEKPRPAVASRPIASEVGRSDPAETTASRTSAFKLKNVSLGRQQPSRVSGTSTSSEAAPLPMNNAAAVASNAPPVTTTTSGSPDFSARDVSPTPAASGSAYVPIPSPQLSAVTQNVPIPSPQQQLPATSHGVRGGGQKSGGSGSGGGIGLTPGSLQAQSAQGVGGGYMHNVPTQKAQGIIPVHGQIPMQGVRGEQMIHPGAGGVPSMSSQPLAQGPRIPSQIQIPMPVPQHWPSHHPTSQPPPYSPIVTKKPSRKLINKSLSSKDTQSHPSTAGPTRMFSADSYDDAYSAAARSPSTPVPDAAYAGASQKSLRGQREEYIPSSTSTAKAESRFSFEIPIDLHYSRTFLMTVHRHLNPKMTKNDIMWSVEKRDSKGKVERRRSSKFSDIPVDRQMIFGTDMKTKKREQNLLLRPSENAYRVEVAKTKMEELHRNVKSLLNKICPDNLKTIVEQLADIQLSTPQELEYVIGVIFRKALQEPHYCATYTDMVFSLRTRYTEFEAENEGDKPVTFTRVLLNTCQDEFENLPNFLKEPSAEIKAQYSPEEYLVFIHARKKRALANMKFIGNLFLRQLLSVKVIVQVVQDLIGIKNGDKELPEEHMIECVCELLKNIGYTLETAAHGLQYVHSFIARLADLKRMTGPKGHYIFSKRIQFAIQDLIDLRGDGWQQKVFKEAAKRKSDIRMEAAIEARLARNGKTGYSITLAGQRPKYIDETIKMKEQKEKEKKYHASIPEAKKTPTVGYAPERIKRILEYYMEEHDASTFCLEWASILADGGENDVRDAIGTILDIGFGEEARMDNCAEVIEILLDNKTITPEQLKEALDPHYEVLEDMKLDYPRCDIFFHMLCTHLCLNVKGMSTSVFKKVPPSRDFGWNLYIGTFKFCREEAGVEGCKKLLPFLQEPMCKVKNYRPEELRRKLRELQLHEGK